MEYCGIDGTPLIETQDDLLVGRTIGRYWIEQPIGRGGVAIVYRARHTVLGSTAAVKVLLGEMACRPIVGERFRREAKAMSRIVHPNVVRIMDFGTTPQGVTYQSMELIEGSTLSRVIADGPLPPERARCIAHDVARGLAAAHRLGFIHRDLKPSNIMLVEEEGRETAKILDFGLVSVVEENPNPRLTQVGVVVGTPQYMAPEVIDSDPPTASADLYALGVTMYEMIAGRTPFGGDTIQEILAAHVQRKPPPLRSAGDLEPLVLRLLAKRAKDRPGSADEVLAILERRPVRKRRRWVPAAIAAPAVAGAFALYFFDRTPVPERAEPVAIEDGPRFDSSDPVEEPLPEVRPPIVAPAKKARHVARNKRRRRSAPRPAALAPIEVSIDSDPPKAKVSLENGGVLGETPLTAILPSDRELWLTLESPQGDQKRVRWNPGSNRVKVRF